MKCIKKAISGLGVLVLSLSVLSLSVLTGCQTTQETTNVFIPEEKKAPATKPRTTKTVSKSTSEANRRYGPYESPENFEANTRPITVSEGKY